MFTGIVQAVGTVAASEARGGDLRLRIACGTLPLEDAAIGDSIATSGVCLTVVELPGDGFWADVSAETLDCTRIGALSVGDRVNLEKSLTPSTPLGGHLVSGHVDGIGEIVSRTGQARSVRFEVQAPAALSRYIAAKGSVCVDGVSLTVNAVTGERFELNIVPHTLAVTTLGELQAGARVNLEVDIIARYLERLLTAGSGARQAESGLDHDFLKRCGFARDD